MSLYKERISRQQLLVLTLTFTERCPKGALLFNLLCHQSDPWLSLFIKSLVTAQMHIREMNFQLQILNLANSMCSCEERRTLIRPVSCRFHSSYNGKKITQKVSFLFSYLSLSIHPSYLFICRAGIQTQTQRTDLQTQWQKGRVRQTGRAALTYIP